MEQIRQAYPRQWLAVEVTEEDSQTRQAKAGEVVATAVTHNEIWEKVHELEKKEDIFVFFNGPVIPEGYIFVGDGATPSIHT